MGGRGGAGGGTSTTKNNIRTVQGVSVGSRPILEHARQIHSKTVAVCGGVRAGLLHLHRYAAGDADLQPLSQALVGGVLANARHDGLSLYIMERRA